MVFNRAEGAWSARDLRRALPRLLKRHPWASYVAIHIGGNDVTAQRPHPGGGPALRRELSAILDVVAAAHRVPILARLSYRAYRRKPRVPPERNGAGPYVREIFDPLIREHCPAFFDAVRGAGRVDLYGWFRAHPEELKRDGIHPNGRGKASWVRLWLEGGRAGRVRARARARKSGLGSSIDTSGPCAALALSSSRTAESAAARTRPAGSSSSEGRGNGLASHVAAHLGQAGDRLRPPNLAGRLGPAFA